eukprot:gb/GEZN01000908.1/.p1 GENE.gb/GEZN01000908.1/~~gb/GEZN01000908.1/.p1  ORF type:complete len:970 (-),score=146.71 gb/GEZN01000908.1/:610-3483(-)
MMMGGANLGEGLLGGETPVRQLGNPLRAAIALAGMAFVGASGWLSNHVLRSSADSAAPPPAVPQLNSDVNAFVPGEGVDKVLIKPGPTGLLQLIPPAAALADVHCLFSYGVQLEKLESNDKFKAGGELDDAWLYGAKLAGSLAQVTGVPGDVLKGKTFCWPKAEFPHKLLEADKFRGYSKENQDTSPINKQVVSVVKKDGTTKHAYFYYQGEVPDSHVAFYLASSPIRALSWNLAAINNNPFEYHSSGKDPKYDALMAAVEDFMLNPGERDIPVSQVFTEEYLAQLNVQMNKLGWDGVDEVNELWNSDFSKRPIVSKFLLDAEIERKRLVSMPDRVTSTINTMGGLSCRPAVTNGYEGRLDSVSDWWAEWKEWMFIRGLRLASTQGSSKKPYQLLRKIRSPKYPLTAEEERISLPLQLLSLAIFDSIMVHIVNTVAPDTWLPLKKELLATITNRKIPRSLDIMSSTYADYDFLCLQEAATRFVVQVTDRLGKEYFAIVPEDMVSSRDQNSVMLLRSTRFDDTSVEEITFKVKERFKGTVGLGSGDLLVVTVRERSVRGGQPYILASFHGDNNGQATVPVLQALVKAQQEDYPQHKIIIGLDANSYKEGSDTVLGVAAFAESFLALGLTSNRGDKPDPNEYTTSSARTYLQPKLNQAVKLADRLTKGDRNPKDFILFTKEGFSPSDAQKDNTGYKAWKKDILFPTADFPSDHALVSVKLSPARISAEPVRLIVWDLDGTLAASRSLGYVVTNQVMEARGYKRITQKEYDLGTAYPTIGRMSFHLTGTTTDPIGKVLADDFDIATVKLILSGKSDVVMYPGATDLLTDLQNIGIQQAILSNGIGEYVRAILKVNHVQNFFNPVLGADMVPNAKPKPDGIIMIGEKLATPLTRAVYIGDSPSDAKAGRAAGIPSIGVAWGSHTMEELSPYFDVMCADFYSLREVLRSMGCNIDLAGRPGL